MLIFVLFTINGCEQEEIFNKTTIEKSNLKLIIIDSQQLALNTSLIKELNKVKQLNTTNFLRSIDEETFNFRVNTDKAKYIEKGDKHSYTFSITRNNSDGNMENLVFTLNKEGGYNAVLVKYDFTDEQYLKITKEGFSLRKVIYTPINYDYKDLVKKNNNRSAGWGCSESWEVIAVISPRNFVVTHYEWVLASSNCSFYSNYDVSGQEDIAGGNLDMYTSPMEENSGGGSGGESTSLELEDDKIINNLTGKANCVYRKLEDNSILKKTLEKFVGEKTPVHLVINLEPNLRDSKGNLVNGLTNYGSSFYITITLNAEQSNNRPSLDVARTILHEAIHAEIYRKIKTTSGLHLNSLGQWVLGDGAEANFPTLFDYYERHNDPQHEYMADYYRTAMVTGLKEYARSTGQIYPDQLYKDLAWNGLRDTYAWANMYADYNFTLKEQQRIVDAVNNFLKDKTNECE